MPYKLRLATSDQDLPRKAFVLHESNDGSVGAKVDGGSHDVTRFPVTLKNGDKNIAYLKRVTADKNYSPLLAQYSCAFAAFSKVILGARSADTRLVYDTSGDLIGTLSLGLNNFYALDGSKPGPEKFINPNVNYLLEANFAELMVRLWLGGDDDAHSGNVSLAGLFDFDMFYYGLTSVIKGPREVDRWTQRKTAKDINVSSEDIDNSLLLQNRTYAPGLATSNPLRPNFTNNEAVNKLANNPHIMVNGKRITYNRQLYSAMLKELIAYQPKILRQELNLQFGDKLLDLSSLTESEIKVLQERFPKVFTNEIIHGGEPVSFVDHCMNFFENYRKNIFNVIVHYTGKTHQDPVKTKSSFCDFLLNTPSAYKEIRKVLTERNQSLTEKFLLSKERIKAKNNRMRIKEKQKMQLKLIQSLQTGLSQARSDQEREKIKQQARIKQKKILDQIDEKYSTIEHFELTEEERLNRDLYYDMELLDEQYYRVFRESHSIKFTPFLKQLNGLKEQLSGEVLEQISTLYNSLKEIIEDFTHKSRNPNYDEFKQEIESLFSEDKIRPIKELIGNDLNIGLLATIIKNVKEIVVNLNFSQHKDLPDNVFKAVDESSSLVTRDQLDDDVVHEFMKTMFSFIRKLEEKDRINNTKYLEELFEKALIAYEPHWTNIFTQKNRGEVIARYIKNSAESYEDKLAFILSEGGTKSNSFNTILIKLLAETMSQSELIKDVSLNWVAVKSVIDSRTVEFQAAIYAKKAQEYVRKNPNCRYTYSERIKQDAFDKLYLWADKYASNNPANFYQLCMDISNDYVKSTRRNERSQELFGLMEEFKHEIDKIGALVKNNSDLTSVKEQESVAIQLAKSRQLGRKFILKVFASKGEESTLTNLLFTQLLNRMSHDSHYKRDYRYLYRTLLSCFDYSKYLQNIQTDAIIRLARIDKDYSRWGAINTIVFMQDALYDWVEENPDKFNQLMRESITLYCNASWWSYLGKGGERKDEIESILDSIKSSQEKLKLIFSKGDVTRNSYNTFSLVGLYNAMMDDLSVKSDCPSSIKALHPRRYNYDNCIEHLGFLNAYANNFQPNEQLVSLRQWSQQSVTRSFGELPQEAVRITSMPAGIFYSSPVESSENNTRPAFQSVPVRES